MDKKTLLGIIIIGAIFIGFTWYNTREQAKFQAVKDSLQLVEQMSAALDSAEQKQQTIITITSDSTQAIEKEHFQEQLKSSLGTSLFDAMAGEEKLYTVENDLLKITFTNKGARVASVELKDYKTYKNTPLILFEKEKSQFNVSMFTSQQINTSDFYFQTNEDQNITVTENERGQDISFKLHADSSSYIEYLYTIYKDNYMIDFKMNFVNMDNIMSHNQRDLLISWQAAAPQNEKGFKNENNYTTIAYMYPNDTSLEELGMSDKSKEKELDTKLKWVAFKQQFFSTILVAKDDFQNGKIQYETLKDGYVKDFQAQLSVPYSPRQTNYDFQFYFGPNKYSVLNDYDLGVEKLVPMGGWLIGWINRFVVIPVFDFLGKYIVSYGLIILILTILIKIVILPLTYKSYISMANMRLLKPDIDKISEKYPKPDDAVKKQQATMELYKSMGVSPMGGCLPMLIQFPILIAMFRFFPASIELRGKSFLWADDLSSYDSILNLPFDIPFYGSHVSLFALLMAVSIYVSSRISYAQNSGAGPQMAGMKFMTLYLMPVMMLFWFNSYSSGLSYYYLLSNIITVGQTYGFRLLVSDKKLHAKMKIKAKKPVKKSKWQQKYDELLKAQQQQQNQQQRKK